MKHCLAALSASVAIGLAGCSDKAPDTAPVDVLKPAITTSAPVNQALDTTRIKVVKACAPQDLKTPLGYKEKYAEEYKEWFKGCDPEVQALIQASTTWKNKTKGGSYSDFQSLTYRIEETTKLMELVKKDPSLKSKLTGGTKIVLKDKLYMYGVISNVESAEVRVPTWQEVLDGKADLSIAIGAMQDK